MMTLPLTGGCQCGEVRYRIAAAPVTVYACHCRDCQRQTGAAFALSMVVAREAIGITAGAPREWLRPGSATASGTATLCLLCRTCGARLYHLPERNPQVAIVKPGTLDDTSWLAAVGHIWTDHAQPWVAIPAATVNFPRQPPDFAALAAAWAARTQPRAAR
ncbi:MAG TPA: GFA family protein [Stellaceae bacterium]|nr:GFA family protein [Stellaceae bacterium]